MSEKSNGFSAKEFAEIRESINQEMKRRGTYRWWNPLSAPKVGEDKTPPLSFNGDESIPVDDKTYTVNNPSSGSIEQTRNIEYPAHGNNPAGKDPTFSSVFPTTSSASVDSDEMRNMLVGLSKIKDINLFYGRDEVPFTAFRDISGIKEVLESAKNDQLHIPLNESDFEGSKNDPNGGLVDMKHDQYPVRGFEVNYEKGSDGKFVMPSGEYDGEETTTHIPLGPNNFYDDYGASPGDSDYHPYNKFKPEIVDRSWREHDNLRNPDVTKIAMGGRDSSRFGPNPRNPEMGDPYPSRPVYTGTPSTCENACTGLCHTTCDSECSENCATTCFSRCGNACTSTCGNACTGCSSMCYHSCQTKCENNVGYSCVKAGAKTMEIVTEVDADGVPHNKIHVTTHACNGCSFSCQFYPNKKTHCWDSGCMGNCFTSCISSCSESCYGGCIGNQANGDRGESYKSGTGQGCSNGCTLNCVGLCSGVCEGYCVQTCWHSCKQSCSDNCTYECSTKCGNGCANGCTKGCGGCVSCTGTCAGKAYSRMCTGCGSTVGCTSSCQHDCNSNCIGMGCRSICGIEAAGACEANCRINCTGTSCTSKCSDACSTRCSTCVNTCGSQCGACSSLCSVGCGAACNVTCTHKCQHSCDNDCVQSCSEACGGCSNLCYSCVGMCIGVCSVKCEVSCTNCTNNCTFWCDTSCNRQCYGNCDYMCLRTCTATCATYLSSEAHTTVGPERDPTAEGYIYPHPKNRWEERESFKLIRDILPDNVKLPEEKLVTITFDADRNLLVIYRGKDAEYLDDVWTGYVAKQTTYSGGVYTVNPTTGEVTIDSDMLSSLRNINKPNFDDGTEIYAVVITKQGIAFDDIETRLPFGFEALRYVKDVNGNIVVIIKRLELTDY